MRFYRTVFSREAMAFVATTDDDMFDDINRWVDRIERTPFKPGDYTEQDEDQRELQVIVLESVAIAYWPDHGAQEVRIVRVEANRDR